MNEIKILVCCHKPVQVPEDDLYLPIHVGKALSEIHLDMQTDDRCLGQECDNISSLNSIYCEMTAMYWAWKNIRKIYPDIQYVGLCHYRRYFNANSQSFTEKLKGFKHKLKIHQEIKRGTNLFPHFLEKIQTINSIDQAEFKESTQKLKNIIPQHDITTASPIRLLNNDVRTFFNVIGRYYIDLLEEIVINDYPEYRQTIQNVLKGSELYSGNMIIMKTSLLDEYCNFMFPVLQKHLEETKNRNICQSPETEKCYARISGYLAEILTSTFISKKSNEADIGIVGKYFIA